MGWKRGPRQMLKVGKHPGNNSPTETLNAGDSPKLWTYVQFFGHLGGDHLRALSLFTRLLRGSW